MAMTYDGVTLTLYKNGVVVDTNTISTFLPIENTAAFLIGTSIFNEGFNGSLDNVQVHNYARTQAQIQLDMVTPLP